MKRLLGIAFLTLAAAVPVRGESLNGRAVVGKQTYTVTGEVSRAGDSLRVVLILSGSAISHRVDLELGRITECRLDGEPQDLAPSLVSSWHEQVASGLMSLVRMGGFREVKSKPEFVDYESEAFFELRKGLPGRLRLSYHRDHTPAVLRSGGLRLVGVRFFSLAEWNNTFGEYVSLSLDIG